MRVCLGAALLGAAAYLGTGVALAGDGGATALLFSGTDLWRNGSFLHGGVLWSPDGLDREGFTAKLSVSGGRYRYISGALGNTQVTGRELTAQVLPGWRFKWGATELTVFGGLDLQSHRLMPDDPSSALRGGQAGARTAFTLWTEPLPDAMAAADGSLSSIGAEYSLRGAVGYRFVPAFYLGPEVQTFAADDYRQTRIGLHMTGLHIGASEISAAAGWVTDSDRRSGGYVRFGILTRR